MVRAPSGSYQSDSLCAMTRGQATALDPGAATVDEQEVHSTDVQGESKRAVVVPDLGDSGGIVVPTTLCLLIYVHFHDKCAYILHVHFHDTFLGEVCALTAFYT